MKRKIIKALLIQLFWVVLCLLFGILIIQNVLPHIEQPWYSILCLLVSILVYCCLYVVTKKEFIMKSLIQCLGTIVYSTIAGYLLWLLFYWCTPYIMGVGWLLFLLYIFLAGGFISAVISFVNNILLIPMIFLMKNNIVAKIINALVLLYFSYSTILLPWNLNMDYEFLQYIIGISLTITYLISFGSMMAIPFTLNTEEI